MLTSIEHTSRGEGLRVMLLLTQDILPVLLFLVHQAGTGK
jgi:hypothetical protein